MYEWLEDSKTLENDFMISWNKIWSLKLPVKIKLFAWKLVHRILLAGNFLAYRRIASPSKCHLCRLSWDLAFHSIFSFCFTSIIRGTEPLDWFSNLILVGDYDKLLCLVICIIWLIWFAHNAAKHGEEILSPSLIWNKSLCIINEMGLDLGLRPYWREKWLQSPLNRITVNMDASFVDAGKAAGGALMANDSDGELIVGKGFSLEAASELEAEACALLIACEDVAVAGWARV